MTRTSSPPADTVVLIHGLGRTPRSMWVVGAWLRFCGYRVRFIGYPSRSVSIAEAVEQGRVTFRVVRVGEDQRLTTKEYRSRRRAGAG